LSINASHFAAREFEAALANLRGHITDVTLPEVAIYREGARGAHASDKAFVVSFRKI
jgi:hypothetical protein